MSSEEPTLPTDIETLESNARHAYEQNRTRECLDLTELILAVHPDNETAHKLQSAIRSDIDQILIQARELLEEGSKHDYKLGRARAIEVMLAKVIDVDPNHKTAKSLLQAANELAKDSTQQPQRPRLVVVPKPEPPQAEAPKPEPVRQEPVRPEPARVEAVRKEDGFTTAYAAKPKQEDDRARGSWIWIPVLVLVIALVIGGAVYARYHYFSKPATVASVPNLPIAAAVSPTSATPTDTSQTPATGTQQGATTAATATVPSVNTPTIVVRATPQPLAPAQFGSLAVSSPIPADIYAGDQFLGSTPTTLQLSAGTHTLEYRHENLRKLVTHVVKADETTTALVTFDVIVQINAKPWAQVFIDGPERQALGQTPLSDVHLPIGRVIVFENPQFPPKSYRVTGKETAIQVVFP
jgi:hypothetical protein